MSERIIVQRRFLQGDRFDLALESLGSRLEDATRRDPRLVDPETFRVWSDREADGSVMLRASIEVIQT